MAVGLGMSPDEVEDLKSQVDDSFWVMRVIGMYCAHILLLSVTQPPARQVIPHYPTTSRAIRAEPTSKGYPPHHADKY